jgi:hypothetical protein
VKGPYHNGGGKCTAAGQTPTVVTAQIELINHGSAPAHTKVITRLFNPAGKPISTATTTTIANSLPSDTTLLELTMSARCSFFKQKSALPECYLDSRCCVTSSVR